MKAYNAMKGNLPFIRTMTLLLLAVRTTLTEIRITALTEQTAFLKDNLSLKGYHINSNGMKL